jgi:hypothetical protein
MQQCVCPLTLTVRQYAGFLPPKKAMLLQTNGMLVKKGLFYRF